MFGGINLETNKMDFLSCSENALQHRQIYYAKERIHLRQELGLSLKDVPCNHPVAKI